MKLLQLGVYGQNVAYIDSCIYIHSTIHVYLYEKWRFIVRTDFSNEHLSLCLYRRFSILKRCELILRCAVAFIRHFLFIFISERTLYLESKSLNYTV